LYQDQLKYFNTKTSQVPQPVYTELKHCQSRTELETAGDSSSMKKPTILESPRNLSENQDNESPLNVPYNSPMKGNGRIQTAGPITVNTALQATSANSPKLRYIEEQLNSMASFIGESGSLQNKGKRRFESGFVTERRGTNYNNISSSVPTNHLSRSPIYQSDLASGIQEYTRNASRVSYISHGSTYIS
jgi:hypothetical protein